MKAKYREQIVGALARGYCHENNGNKILDPDLISAMEDELIKVPFIAAASDLLAACKYSAMVIKDLKELNPDMAVDGILSILEAAISKVEAAP
jgi:hypothetical protein